MIIKPFLDIHKKSLYQLCELLSKKYHYDNQIPSRALSSHNFEGFIATSEDGVLIGFVGVVFTPAYAFPFGLRAHPDQKGAGLALSKYINKYALSKSPMIRSAFLSDNKAMQKIISADGWKSIGNYFILTRESPFDDFKTRNEISLATSRELNEIINFAVLTKTGQKEYDQMFLKDLIWHPTVSSKEVFEELMISKRLLVGKIKGHINAVCVLDKKDDSSDIIGISRLWGKPEPILNFITQNYRPHKIKICIGEIEKEKWQKLGFLTSMVFYGENLFESKYALIEKKRPV